MAERNTKPASSSNANATVAVRPSNSGSNSNSILNGGGVSGGGGGVTTSQVVNAAAVANAAVAASQMMHRTNAGSGNPTSTVSNLSQMAKILPQIFDGIVIFLNALLLSLNYIDYELCTLK